MLGFAIKSQREEAAWTEGIAIWVAVGVVSLVGEDLLTHNCLFATVTQRSCTMALLMCTLCMHIPERAALLTAGAGNDYQKDLQFKKLNAAKDEYDVKVIRKGAEALVPNTAIVAGDVIILDTGDKIIADAYLIVGHGLVVDEASLTGESEPVRKGPEDCWCRSGTQVEPALKGCLRQCPCHALHVRHRAAAQAEPGQQGGLLACLLAIHARGF